MTGQAITRDEAKLMILAVAKQHADAGNAWQAASIVAAVDTLAEPAQAIDLEQFREAVTYFRDAYSASSLGPDSWQSAKADEADRLLALIDGQANVRSSSEHSSALNTLARMFHNGEEMEGPDGMAVSVDLALWHEASEAFDVLIGDCDAETLADSTEAQPTKGEGE